MQRLHSAGDTAKQSESRFNTFDLRENETKKILCLHVFAALNAMVMLAKSVAA